MTEKVDAKKTPFIEALKICPLLSMANASGEEWEHCHEEGCKFYLSKLPQNMEKCIWVRMAISLGQIAEHLSRESAIPTHPLAPKSDLDKSMASLRRQHRP